MPDYRETYKCESIRHGHSERMKLLIEELLCLEGKQSRVVLIGKSQGSAVSASVCSARVARASKIVGLILLGGENPLSYNRQLVRPDVPLISVIHASGDRVIHPETMIQLSGSWNMQSCHILPSQQPQGSKDLCFNDIAHAFLEKNLFRASMEIIKSILQTCETITIN